MVDALADDFLPAAAAFPPLLPVLDEADTPAPDPGAAPVPGCVVELAVERCLVDAPPSPLEALVWGVPPCWPEAAGAPHPASRIAASAKATMRPGAPLDISASPIVWWIVAGLFATPVADTCRPIPGESECDASGGWRMSAPGRRILIIGPGGSGKSTLAVRLSQLLDLPVHHLDALYWRPGWVPTPSDQWRRVQEALLAAPEWIMDGNYGGTLDRRLAAADTVVVLDLPPATCVVRAVRRSLRHVRRWRPDMAPGCPERLNGEYLRFLWWIWTYRRRRLPGILERLAALATVRVIHLRRDSEIRTLLAQWTPLS